MLQYLKNIDRDIFFLVNSHYTEFFDKIMWFLSGNIIWIIIVALILTLLIKKYKTNFWIFFLSLAICFLFTEQITNLLKHLVQRYRPTHNTEISLLVHIVNNYKGGLYSFPSGHATNSFGLAVLSSIFIRKKWFTIFITFWAFFVCYSRIYLGVHYPIDIITGIIIGFVIAVGVFYLLKFILKRKQLLT